MDKIKASALQAAINLTAKLFLNDGKYEQWQALFVKQLKDVTGLPWKDMDWSEKNLQGENLHILTLKIPEATINLYFHEDEAGYNFAEGYMKFKTALAGRPSPGNNYQFANAPAMARGNGAHYTNVNSGKDLLAAAVKILIYAGLMQAPEPVAPTTLHVANLKELEALQRNCAMVLGKGYAALNSGKTVATGSLNFSLVTPYGGVIVEAVFAQAGEVYALSRLGLNGGSAKNFLVLKVEDVLAIEDFVYTVKVGLKAAPFAKLDAPATQVVKVGSEPDSQVKKETLKALTGAMDAIKAGDIGRPEATANLKRIFQAINLKVAAKNPVGQLQEVHDSVTLGGLSDAQMERLTSELEDLANSQGVTKPEVMQLLQKVKKNVGEWSVRDKLLDIGRNYIQGFDYVSLDEATAAKIVDQLYGMVRGEELDWTDTLDIYDQFQHMINR